MLGMELATRRRNRVNGVMRPTGDAFVIDVPQSFGNCPQYITCCVVRPGFSPISAPHSRRAAFLGTGSTSKCSACGMMTKTVSRGYLLTRLTLP